MLRLFTWRDTAALASIAREAATGSDTAWLSRKDVEEYLRQPNLRPERDCFVAEMDGVVTGYTLVVPELSIGRAIIDGAVHPTFRRRGIGEALLAEGLAHSRALGATLAHVSASSSAPATSRALAAAGFSEARRQWQMRLDVLKFARGRPLSGVHVRPMAPGEEPLMAEMQNRAFAGSWGFAPNTAEEIAYRVRMRGGQPKDTLFLLLAGRPAAYCWTKLTDAPGGPVGVIWMIGVDPDARGQGLGRAMLDEGLDHLKGRGAHAVELTVYQDNTPAVQLYRSIGFQPSGEIVWYERRL